MAKKKISKSMQKKIGKERISILFSKAEEVYNQDPLLSNRYVTLARKISMKLRMRIAPEYKKKFCKHCYSFLMPGKNSRIRINSGKVIILCKECNKFMRIPLLKRITNSKQNIKKE